MPVLVAHARPSPFHAMQAETERQEEKTQAESLCARALKAFGLSSVGGLVSNQRVLRQVPEGPSLPGGEKDDGQENEKAQQYCTTFAPVRRGRPMSFLQPRAAKLHKSGLQMLM